jgi:N-acetylneuraminic acid mutarotase
MKESSTPFEQPEFPRALTINIVFTMVGGLWKKFCLGEYATGNSPRFQYTMKALPKFFVLQLWGLSSLQASAAPSGKYCVKTLAPIRGAPRQEHTVVSTKDKVFVLGGLRGPGEILTPAVEVYHTANDSWTETVPLPFGATHINVAAVEDTLYYLGGMSMRGAGTYRLQPGKTQWEPLAPMPNARSSAVTVVHGKTIWLAGGMSRGLGDAVSSYDSVANKWTNYDALRLPEARDHAGGAVVDGIFYLVGGRVLIHTQNRATVFALNLTALASGQEAKWVTKAPMPAPRGGIAVAAAGRKIYVFGGEGNAANPNGVFPDVAVYDVAKDSWDSADPMTMPRHGFGAASVGDKVYVPGGGGRLGGGLPLAVNEAYWQC